MAEPNNNNLAAIPKRSEIPDKYKWNVADIYKSETDWEADFQKVQQLVTKAPQFKGKLAANAATLFEALETRTQIGLISSSLFQYAKLNRDLDGRNSKYQAMTERANMLMAEATAAFSFIEPELLKLSDDEIKKLAAQFEKKDIYDFYIKELIRSREHIRSEEVEELLAMTSPMAGGPENIFSYLDDADLKYPTIKDEQGNEVQLTKQRYAKFLESADQRVRRDANDGLISAYKDHLNTIGATLATEVNANLFYTKARRFKGCLEAALNENNIPVKVYHALLDTTEAHLEGLHKWMALRKKILKLDKIMPYDILCPLFPDKDYEVPYDQAVTQVLDAVKPLGEKYGTVLKQGFDSRWVDVRETEGKTSGAYSWGNYQTHPFVLMNYNDTVDNMFTLGHEMGHAMHSYLSNTTQTFTKSHYSIFVAEVASTLNEGLILQHLLKKAQDKTEKLYLLNRHIDNTMGTYFHQVLYARFELLIHEHVEKGQALSPEWLNERWAELTQKYYGPAMTLDEFAQYKWSRIPHFYLNFYVYQYATSYAASQAILDKFLSGEPGIIDKYLELLKSGGKDYPIELLKACGVDMTSAAPFEATVKLFAQQVDEVDRLTK